MDGGQGCQWQTRLLKEVDITRPPYTTRYPNLVGFMNPQPGQPRVNHAKNNLLVRCEQIHSGNWKYTPEEMWATDRDPGFVDAPNGNFLLRADAEVFQHLPGFKPIPFDKSGRSHVTVSASAVGTEDVLTIVTPTATRRATKEHPMNVTDLTRRAWLNGMTTIGVTTMTIKPARPSPQAVDTAALKPFDLGSRGELFVDRLLIDRLPTARR